MEQDNNNNNNNDNNDNSNASNNDNDDDSCVKLRTTDKKHFDFRYCAKCHKDNECPDCMVLTMLDGCAKFVLV